VNPTARRQGRLCVAAALVSYFGPALVFVVVHHGWEQIEPYLRGHLFDAFGCAALYTLAFRQFRLPWPQIQLAKYAWRWLNIRVQLSAMQLTLASAAIAAASVFTAGGDFQAVALGGVLAALILQGFWTGVISGVSGAAIAEAIIVHDRRVLLVRERHNILTGWWAFGSFSSEWRFPFGKIETDETARQAAVRVAMKETTILVVPRSVLGERLYLAPMRDVIYVTCDLISGIPCMAAADEITKVMWCDIDQYRRHISPTWGTTAMRAYVETALRTGQQAES
jgi:8-oxo-dGTP pyrophosphatase MutT (NUDIX family)